MIRIGIDVTSGESSPTELFLSLLDYSKVNKDDHLYIYLDQETITKYRKELKACENITVIPVEEKILMHDNPIKSLKRKKNSSIVKGLKNLKKGMIDLFFSPGNTGAIVYGAIHIVGMIKDIQYPAIGVFMPNIFNEVLLLDAGASPYIDEDIGLELAIMGKIFYQNYFKKKDPEVGLLNVGKEWHKGSKWVRKLDSILKKEKAFNYFGYVEGFDLLTSECRVFVTGGYTGNILLKGIEGVYYYLKEILGDKNQAFINETLKKKLHYSRKGAGLLLGLKKDIFIGHGITKPEALINALVFAKEVYKLKLARKIQIEIKNRRFISRLLSRRRRNQ